MTGQCPLCGQNRELREIDGVTTCFLHVSAMTWERRSTHRRDRETAPALVTAGRDTYAIYPERKCP